MASKVEGNVSFSIAEDSISLGSQATLMGKIADKPLVDGFIFFTLRQFFYGDNQYMKALRFVLDSGYEAHFAREEISIYSQEDLDRLFPMIYSTYYLLERDEPGDYCWPVWDQVS